MASLAQSPVVAADLIKLLFEAKISKFCAMSCDGVLALEHDDTSASTNHRAEQMRDARVLLTALGLDVYEETSTRILVFGYLSRQERCEECHAPSPGSCECPAYAEAA